MLLGSAPLVDTSSASCGTCHVSQFTEWRTSIHAAAANNSLYVANYTQWPMKWCDACHLPQGKVEEGVGCASCHVKAGLVLTTRKVSAAGLRAHAERTEPSLSTEQACASCHQFNVPMVGVSNTGRWLGKEDEHLVYSRLAMQNTLAEWKQWGGERACQSCHLPKGSHAMTGGHDLERLKRALSVEVERVDASRVAVTLHAQKAGHRVPTGDAFRVVRVELFDSEGALVGRARYGHFSGVADGGIDDQTAPPPLLDGGSSSRRFTVQAPRAASYRVVFEFVGPLTAPLVLSESEVELFTGRLRFPNLQEEAP